MSIFNKFSQYQRERRYNLPTKQEPSIFICHKCGKMKPITKTGDVEEQRKEFYDSHKDCRRGKTP